MSWLKIETGVDPPLFGDVFWWALSRLSEGLEQNPPTVHWPSLAVVVSTLERYRENTDDERGVAVSTLHGD